MRKENNSLRILLETNKWNKNKIKNKNKESGPILLTPASTKAVSAALTHRAMTWGRRGCRLPLMTVHMEAGVAMKFVCLLVSSCVLEAQGLLPISGMSGCSPCSAQPHSIASYCSSSARWTHNREREVLISHKYLFILAEGKKVIYVCSCLQQIM